MQTYTGETELKIQYETFVKGLIAGLTKSEAYRQCGYKSKSPDTSAIALTKRPDIQARLSYLTREATKGLDLTIDRILEEDMCIGFADAGDLVDAADNLIPLADLPSRVSRALSSVKATTDAAGRTVYEYKFWPKDKSLDRFYRYKGLYERDNEQKVPQFMLAVGRADEDKAKQVESSIKERDLIEGEPDTPIKEEDNKNRPIVSKWLGEGEGE